MKKVEKVLKGIDLNIENGDQKCLVTLDKIPDDLKTSDIYFDKKRNYFVLLKGEAKQYVVLGFCVDAPLLKNDIHSCGAFGFNLEAKPYDTILEHDQKVLEKTEQKVLDKQAEEFVCLFDAECKGKNFFDNIVFVQINELTGYRDFLKVSYIENMMNDWLGRLVTPSDFVENSVDIFSMAKNTASEQDCFSRASSLNQIMERFDNDNLTKFEKQLMQNLKFNAKSMLCNQTQFLAWKQYFQPLKFGNKENEARAKKLYKKYEDKIAVYSKTDDFGFYIETCKSLHNTLQSELETKFFNKTKDTMQENTGRKMD